MLSIVRLPYTVCCRVCITWRRKVFASIFVLSLLSTSVFIVHSLDSKVTKTTMDEAQDTGSSYGKANVDRNLAETHGTQRQKQQHSTRTPDKAKHVVASLPSSSIDTQRSKLRGRNGTTYCSLNDGSSRGPIEADIVSVPSFQELENSLSVQLHLGGHYLPTKCRPPQRIAVIVPYRDRSVHLKMFLRHMHPFLQRQQIEYYIVVVEQAEGESFNRALLFNVGYYKMNKLHDIDCYIFQDVDLLPLDDRIIYRCQEQPLHLSMVVDTLGDNLMYDNLFGGVVALTPGMMATVNGFSNLYFGWGGEDDDMSYRIRSHGYSIDRYSKEVSRYTMMKHAQDDEINQEKINRKVHAGREKIHEDGLNTLVFHLLEFQPLPLYTWIYIKPNRSLSWEDLEVPVTVTVWGPL